MALATRHVLIIGGGLAGPCLALSLARHNIRSTIFEIRAAPSDAGGSISLGPNGLEVLDHYAGVYEKIKATGFTYHRFGAYTDDGERLGQIQVGDDSKGDAGYPAVRIMRTDLHRALLEAIQAKGDLIDVKWGAKLAKIEEAEKGVTAHFEDGTQVEGDILVGADGIHSKVREHVLGPSAPKPVYEQLCVVNGFVPASAVTAPPGFEFPAFMFSPAGLFMTIPIDPKGDTLAWGINITMTERSRAEWRELEKSGEAARVAKAAYDDIQSEPVRSLLDNADDKQAKLWATFSLPDITSWHTPRVCLIGDAAHALPPNGQGSGLAFEDAAILSRLLTAEGATSYEQLFARFEEIRRPRLEQVRAGTKSAGGALKSKTGPWGWYLKKFAFRAFFWWNNGVLEHTKETLYDVNSIDLKI